MEENLKDIFDTATLEEVDKLITETMEFQCNEVTKERIKSSVNKKIEKAKNTKESIKSRKAWRKYGVSVAGLALKDNIVGARYQPHEYWDKGIESYKE